MRSAIECAYLRLKPVKRIKGITVTLTFTFHIKANLTMLKMRSMRNQQNLKKLLSTGHNERNPGYTARNIYNRDSGQ